MDLGVLVNTGTNEWVGREYLTRIPTSPLAEEEARVGFTSQEDKGCARRIAGACPVERKKERKEKEAGARIIVQLLRFFFPFLSPLRRKVSFEGERISSSVFYRSPDATDPLVLFDGKKASFLPRRRARSSAKIIDADPRRNRSHVPLVSRKLDGVFRSRST